jgi:hypothetical protein
MIYSFCFYSWKSKGPRKKNVKERVSCTECYLVRVRACAGDLPSGLKGYAVRSGGDITQANSREAGAREPGKRRHTRCRWSSPRLSCRRRAQARDGR